MMKPSARIFHYCLLIAVTFLTTVCNAGDDMILEYKDVQFFKVTEIHSRKPLVVKISGLAFHSAMSVEKITTRSEQSSLVVYVHLTLARPGLSGRFEYELTVPDSINEVRFGNEKAVIWKRKITP
jgi:hypothetical protein